MIKLRYLLVRSLLGGLSLSSGGYAMEKIEPYVHEGIDFRQNMPLPPYLVKCAELFANEQSHETAKRLVALRDFSDSLFYLNGVINDKEDVASVSLNLEKLYGRISDLYNAKNSPYDIHKYSVRDYHLGLFGGVLYAAFDAMIDWLKQEKEVDLMAKLTEFLEQR